uniref:Uncharacterized protein n=1 Tax=Romanomermis culicivorax TaxID=13658 RepID=A0A915LB03_ROMCU
MKNFQFTVPMPADSTASSYLRYVQLAFSKGRMFIFETFTATPEDWTALFSLVDNEHTIVVSFDGADDWAGIYALLGTQFRTDHQKKNKDPIVKAIHFDAYPVIRNIDISPSLYELAWQIGFFPEKRALKATVSAMWGLDVSKLMLKVPTALRFFNNLAHLSYNRKFLRTRPSTPITPFYCFWLSAITASSPKYTTHPCCFPTSRWRPLKSTTSPRH